jgi:hypothetical protein
MDEQTGQRPRIDLDNNGNIDQSYGADADTI